MARNGTPDRIETAANITLVISRSAGGADIGNYSGSYDPSDEDARYIEIPISRLDATKEVEISEIRESSLKASGYAITSISYSGSMMFKGSRLTKEVPDGDGKTVEKNINDLLYDQYGVPMPVAININHDLTGEPEVYKHVLAVSESYEVRSESETETAFDWVAMDRGSDQPDNSE